MKIKMKRFLSVFLVALMVSSSVFCLDFSAAAAETSDSDIGAVIEFEGEDEISDVKPIVQSGMAAPEVTEPAESTFTTEPTTEPTTVAPTTIPTTAKPAPTVGAVKNLKKTSFETNKITLAWDKVSGATGYYIYYCNADNNTKYTKYTKIADIKPNACTVSNLTHTTSYYFKVSAYIVQDGKIYEGKTAFRKTATQPGNIENLKICRSSNEIEFSWKRNPKATGYKIYRACAKSNDKSVLYKVVTNNKTTSFIDKNIEGGRTYYYRVKAYRDLYGTTYNGISSVTRAACGLCAPNFSMTTQLSRVSLTWKKNKYANGYDVYYATSKNGKYTKLCNTTKDFYNTSKLSNNKTYYFRVQPYKYVGKSKTKVLGTYHTKSIKVTNKAYGKSIGNTYIEISIQQQHMWFYLNGKLYCETDVVTGNNDGYHNTPKGAYKIWQRQSPTTLIGPGYASYVNYWLAFTYSGVGIHDASWRSSKEYGGTTYKGNGSHGCVNTPYSAVKKIYQKAKIGYNVVVY